VVILINEFPILEFDDNVNAIIEPKKIIQRIDIPELVVMCFFNDVIERLKNEGKLKLVTNLKSEMGLLPIYEMESDNKRVVVFHPGIGAPFSAGMMEEVIALGGEKFIACGGAGVLDKAIAVGHIIVPVSAIRDEGTSYHYLPPSREVQVNKKAVEVIKQVLQKHKCKYLLAKTWTTDAFYRETINMVNLRKAEGCLTVEMECSAFCAVAEFRGVVFGQILYGGDDVSCEEWDSRCWNDRTDVREAIFKLGIEACLEL
jgi:uridine phosphorylase